MRMGVMPRIHRPAWSVSLCVHIAIAQGGIALTLKAIELGTEGDAARLESAEELLDELIEDAAVRTYIRETLDRAKQALRIWDFWHKRFPEIESEDDFSRYLEGIRDALHELRDAGSLEAGERVQEFLEELYWWAYHDVPAHLPVDDGLAY